MNLHRLTASAANPSGFLVTSKIEQQLGSIDILVNNAGMAAVRSLDDITEEDFDRAIAVNLKSVFLCTQAVLQGMRNRRWGRIVNISSIGARAGSVSIAYGASKAGVEGLTRGYALRLAAEGVTVNAVAPGLVDTEIGKPLIAAGVVNRIPVGRAGLGDEISQAVSLLVGDGYITGQTIGVTAARSFLSAKHQLAASAQTAHRAVLLRAPAVWSASGKFRADETACSPYTECYA